MGRLTKVLLFVVVLVVVAAGVALAANRIGNNNPNTLIGTDGNDNIYGLGSADTLNGLGGNDEISGNGGADRMNGGEGDDTMVGGAGVDIINTGNSIDCCNVGGTDFVHSVDGNAETVCFGTGDGIFVVDDIDTVKAWVDSLPSGAWLVVLSRKEIEMRADRPVILCTARSMVNSCCSRQ